MNSRGVGWFDFLTRLSAVVVVVVVVVVVIFSIRSVWCVLGYVGLGIAH